MENQVEKTITNQDKQLTADKELSINQDKLNLYMEKLKLEQDLSFGVIAALIASVLSAILWAVITVTTEYQIGFMAVAVGFAVGYAVRYFGKGIDKIFGIIGALFSIIGCLLGNFLSIVGFIASTEGLGYFETLSLLDYSLVPQIIKETFNPIDLLFYGIAIYEGYKFSFRQLKEEDIIANAAE